MTYSLLLYTVYLYVFTKLFLNVVFVIIQIECVPFPYPQVSQLHAYFIYCKQWPTIFSSTRLEFLKIEQHQMNCLIWKRIEHSIEMSRLTRIRFRPIPSERHPMPFETFSNLLFCCLWFSTVQVELIDEMQRRGQKCGEWPFLKDRRDSKCHFVVRL